MCINCLCLIVNNPSSRFQQLKLVRMIGLAVEAAFFLTEKEFNEIIAEI